MAEQALEGQRLWSGESHCFVLGKHDLLSISAFVLRGMVWNLSCPCFVNGTLSLYKHTNFSKVGNLSKIGVQGLAPNCNKERVKNEDIFLVEIDNGNFYP